MGNRDIPPHSFAVAGGSMQEENRPQVRASGGRPSPHACPIRPEDGALGETCPRLPLCLRRLHAIAPAALVRFELGTDGHLCMPFATANLKDLHGHGPEEVRKDATPLFSCLHPQDFDRVLISIIQCARAIRPWISEHRVLLPPAGTQQRWLRSCFVPYANGAAGLTGYGIILDISAEKDSRSELLRLCENAPIGVLLMTPDGRYLSANRNFARMCGFTDPEELIGQGSLAEQCCAGPEELQSLLKLVITRGCIERYALELRVHGGGNAWISLNIRAVRDETGRVETLECYCADISRQVREELAGGRLGELASTTFATEERNGTERDRGTNDPGLCSLLAYVRDTLLWRVRLPFPHSGVPTRSRE